jgi:CRP-like cAMP-binding protein
MCNNRSLVSSFAANLVFAFDPQQFDLPMQISALRTVQPSEILFSEGDLEDYLYFVLDGKIAIEMTVPGQGKALVSTLEPFDPLGWSSVTPVIRQRTASARSLGQSCLLAIDANKLRQLCAEDHDLGYIVYLHLANVVAARLLVTRLQLLTQLGNTIS